MVRFVSILVLGATGWMMLTPAGAWPQQSRSTEPSAIQKGAEQAQPGEAKPRSKPHGEEFPSEADWLAVIFGTPVPKLEPAELAGMAAGGKPAVLTLRQAFALALIRARASAAERLANAALSFDPELLEKRAKGSDVDNFEQFRREFLTPGFRDPVPAFFAVLKHRQAVDSTRSQVAFAENMRRLYEQLTKGEASGVSGLQIDLVEQYLLGARQGLAIALSSYRAGVDDLKVSLDLPVGTPLVVDERILAPFATVESAALAWQRNPQRQLEELTAMHDRLPRLDDVKIGARSLHEVIEGTLPEEEFLRECAAAARARRAVKSDDHAPPEDRNALELRIRQLVRVLILTEKNYEVERRRQELAVREVDQRFERIISPPAGGTQALAQSANAATHATGVITAQSRLDQGRTRFVELWLQFKETEMALYRALGTIPYDDFEAFYQSFDPKAGHPAGKGEAPQ